MIVVGEVHTALLQHSCALSDRDVTHLLDLVPGERVRRSTRPVSHAVSPELLTGLDCDTTAASGKAVRVVGTAVYRAAVLGGHVIQGSTFTEISEQRDKQRQPWAHYLARRGALRPVGKVDTKALADGFLDSSTSPASLDLGAVSARTLDTAQRARLLDRHAPFRSARTRLRWVATIGGDAAADEPPITFTLVNSQIRTATMAFGLADVPAAVQFSEDLAVHDWLLTTVIDLVERARIGGKPRQEVVDRVRPVIDHLAHLWTPTARLHPETERLWRLLEQRPGFSRQWHTLVTRIRDQMTLASLSALHSEGPIRAGL